MHRHLNLLRELVQKVVIAPSADRKSAELPFMAALPVYLLRFGHFRITRLVWVNGPDECAGF